jgi:hypothetical protein
VREVCPNIVGLQSKKKELASTKHGTFLAWRY